MSSPQPHHTPLDGTHRKALTSQWGSEAERVGAGPQRARHLCLGAGVEESWAGCPGVGQVGWTGAWEPLQSALLDPGPRQGWSCPGLGDGASWGRGGHPCPGPRKAETVTWNTCGGRGGPGSVSGSPQAGTSRDRGGHLCSLPSLTLAVLRRISPTPHQCSGPGEPPGPFHPPGRWGALPTGFPRTTSPGGSWLGGGASSVKRPSAARRAHLQAVASSELIPAAPLASCTPPSSPKDLAKQTTQAAGGTAPLKRLIPQGTTGRDAEGPQLTPAHRGPP